MDKDNVKIIGPHGKVAYVSEKMADSPALRAIGFERHDDIIPVVPEKPVRSREQKDATHAG